MAGVRIATTLAVVLTAPRFVFYKIAAGAVFSEEYAHIADRRHLATCSNSDDALDPTNVRRYSEAKSFASLILIKPTFHRDIPDKDDRRYRKRTGPK